MCSCSFQLTDGQLTDARSAIAVLLVTYMRL